MNVIKICIQYMEYPALSRSPPAARKTPMWFSLVGLLTDKLDVKSTRSPPFFSSI